MTPGLMVVVGAGLGGTPTALAASRLGFEVEILERYHEVKPTLRCSHGFSAIRRPATSSVNSPRSRIPLSLGSIRPET
jgi:choline dehydrogenase-like flavoprotein